MSRLNQSLFTIHIVLIIIDWNFIYIFLLLTSFLTYIFFFFLSHSCSSLGMDFLIILLESDYSFEMTPDRMCFNINITFLITLLSLLKDFFGFIFFNIFLSKNDKLVIRFQYKTPIYFDNLALALRRLPN